MIRISSIGFLAITVFFAVGCKKEPVPDTLPPPPMEEEAVTAVPDVAPPVAEKLPLSPPREPLTIHVAGGREAWNSQTADVKAVLDSVAFEMMRSFPHRDVEPVTVYAQGGPITLFKRDSGGEYTVKLATGDRLWAQAAFQFSHELCHILANYREDKNPNGWFEESLCEIASLYTLRAMGRTWETHPPYSNWKSYHQSLTGYAQQRIDDARLLGQQPLSEWYEVREPELRQSKTLRELNNVVAVKLLPLFEENPAGWESIGWLNVEPSFPDDSFREYLERWHHYVPKRHQEFVKKVAKEFGIEIESP